MKGRGRLRQLQRPVHDAAAGCRLRQGQEAGRRSLVLGELRACSLAAISRAADTRARARARVRAGGATRNASMHLVVQARPDTPLGHQVLQCDNTKGVGEAPPEFKQTLYLRNIFYRALRIARWLRS